jgi:hypothetical protein
MLDQQGNPVNFQMSALSYAPATRFGAAGRRYLALGIGGRGVGTRGLRFGRGRRFGRWLWFDWCRCVRWRGRGTVVNQTVVAHWSRWRTPWNRCAESFDRSTVKASRGRQSDRLLKQTYRTASRGPQHAGHWNRETECRQLRLNRADQLRIASRTNR